MDPTQAKSYNSRTKLTECVVQTHGKLQMLSKRIVLVDVLLRAEHSNTRAHHALGVGGANSYDNVD
jgi:hypothetical protein